MSEPESPGDAPPASLRFDQLRDYVLDVMDWTTYEAAAYIAVVRDGPLEPSDIVAMTDIPQGRVYDVLGQLEGVAVTVQGSQPKRYRAHHPRYLIGDKQEEYNEKADTATDQLEHYHEIQRERQDPRYPAWVIPGIAGTKREFREGLDNADDRVLLLEQDGRWIQSNELRDLTRLGDNGVTVEVIGRPRWRDTLDQLVAEAAVDAWVHEHVDSSFGVVDEDLAILRVGRGDTGVKLEDGGVVTILQTAFEAMKTEATEIHPDA